MMSIPEAKTGPNSGRLDGSELIWETLGDALAEPCLKSLKLDRQGE
jgi:hypothetical protein